jgi:hypothetical protein
VTALFQELQSKLQSVDVAVKFVDFEKGPEVPVILRDLRETSKTALIFQPNDNLDAIAAARHCDVLIPLIVSDKIQVSDTPNSTHLKIAAFLILVHLLELRSAEHCDLGANLTPYVERLEYNGLSVAFELMKTPDNDGPLSVAKARSAEVVELFNKLLRGPTDDLPPFDESDIQLMISEIERLNIDDKIDAQTGEEWIDRYFVRS